LFGFLDFHLLGKLKPHDHIATGAYAAHACGQGVSCLSTQGITYAYLQPVDFGDFH